MIIRILIIIFIYFNLGDDVVMLSPTDLKGASRTHGKNFNVKLIYFY